MACVGMAQAGGAVSVAVGNPSALDSLRRFVGGIESFNRLFPQEKAYLHFDNTGYFRGETMWFSAYVVRTDLGSLTDLSRVLYVELLDPTGEVVSTRKVRLEKVPFYLKNGFVPLTSEDAMSATRLLYFDLNDIA